VLIFPSRRGGKGGLAVCGEKKKKDSRPPAPTEESTKIPGVPLKKKKKGRAPTGRKKELPGGGGKPTVFTIFGGERTACLPPLRGRGMRKIWGKEKELP